MKYRNDNLNHMVYELEEDFSELRMGTIYPYNNGINDFYVPFVKIIEPNDLVSADDIMKNQTEAGVYLVRNANMTEDIRLILDDKFITSNWVPVYDDTDIESIIKDVSETDLTAATNAPFISSCGSDKFIPAFYPSDNILNTAMKTALVYKGINIDGYRGKFANTSDFNNNRRHLVDEKYSSLSYPKFEKLCEIFDLDFEIILRDKAGSKNPMGREIAVHSDGTKEGADDIEMYIKYLREGNEESEEEDEE